MLKSVLKVGVVLVVGILVYNYFFGDDQEKAQSKAIAAKIGEVGKASAALLGTEYKKFREGKYDNALDKIAESLNKAKRAGTASVDKVQSWERDYKAWKEASVELKEKLESAGAQIPDELKEKAKSLAQKGEQLEKTGSQLSEKN